MFQATILLALTIIFTSLRGEASSFDHWILAISYQNQFCATHPKKLECKKQFNVPVMGLHGLWPNLSNDPEHSYQYCAIARQTLSKDWCAPETDVRSQMSEPVFALLKKTMPGTQSCLYNHEWYAHGTCSGLGVEGYFKLSAELTQKFQNQAKKFYALLSDRFGKSVTRQELMHALKSDLGKEIESSLDLNCRGNYLSEIFFTLKTGKLAAFPAPASLEESEDSDHGSCPESGIQISTGAPARRTLHAGGKGNGGRISADATGLSIEVANLCPCSKFPGKSFCHSLGFAMKDGVIFNFRDDGRVTAVQGNYSSVQAFVEAAVCK